MRGWLALGILSLLLSAQTARADSIRLDVLTPGDRLLVRDFDDDLDWLSFVATSSGIPGHPPLDTWLNPQSPWRYATPAEVCARLVRLGAAPSPCPGYTESGLTADAVSRAQRAFGVTLYWNQPAAPLLWIGSVGVLRPVGEPESLVALVSTDQGAGPALVSGVVSAVGDPFLPWGHGLVRPRPPADWAQLPPSSRQPAALEPGPPFQMGSFPYRVDDGNGGVVEQGVTFRVWAPNSHSVAVLDVAAMGENGLFDPGDADTGWTAYLACQDTGETAECPSGTRPEHCPCLSGIWSGDVPGAWVGDRYTYLTAADSEGTPVIRRDPRALLAEGSFHDTQASVVYDRFEALNPQPHVWTDGYFIRPRQREMVLIHGVLPFLAPGGSFDDAIVELEQLRELGANALQLEPLTEHPTQDTPLYDPFNPPSYGLQDPQWNNAYVVGDPFTVEGSFGGPGAYKRFVDAAHGLGIAVQHEVKLNFWNDIRSSTLIRFDGWSSSDRPNGIYFWDVDNGIGNSDFLNLRPDYGSEAVRRYLDDGMRQWLDEFHVDGFRFDQAGFSFYEHFTSGLLPGGELARDWHREFHEQMHASGPRIVSIAENIPYTDLGPEGVGFDAVWWYGILNDVFKFPLNASQIATRFGIPERLTFEQTSYFREIYSGDFCGEVEPLIVRIARGGTISANPDPICQEALVQAACTYDPPLPPLPENFVACDAARRRLALLTALKLTAPGLPIIDLSTLFLRGNHARPEELQAGNWSQLEPGMWLLFKELIHLRRDIQDLPAAGALAAGEDVPGISGGLIGAGFTPDSSDPNLLIWHRFHLGGPGDDVFVVANLSGVVRMAAFNFPAAGVWKLRLRTDDHRYGYVLPEAESTMEAGFTVTEPGHTHELTLQPYTAVVYSQDCADADADGICDHKDNCSARASRFVADVNGDGFGNACDGDLDDNGMAGMSDFGMFQQRFGGHDALADFDGDDAVGASDFVIFKTFFAHPPGPSGLDCAGSGELCTGP
jgi:1,4-alpha-glucan branching enzyme